MILKVHQIGKIVDRARALALDQDLGALVDLVQGLARIQDRLGRDQGQGQDLGRALVLVAPKEQAVVVVVEVVAEVAQAAQAMAQEVDQVVVQVVAVALVVVAAVAPGPALPQKAVISPNQKHTSRVWSPQSQSLTSNPKRAF